MPTNREKERINRIQTEGRVSRLFANADHPANISHTLGRLSSFFVYRRWALCIVMIMVVCESLLIMRLPLLIGGIVDAIVTYRSAALIAAKGLYIQLFVIYILRLVISKIRRNQFAKVSQQIIYDVRCALFDKLSKLPLSYLDRHPYGDVMGRFTHDVQAVSSGLFIALSDLVEMSLKIVIAFVMMLSISWQMTVLVLCILPLFFIVTRMVSRRARPLYRRQAKGMGALFALTEEYLSGIDVLRDFNQVDRAVDEYKAVKAEYKAVSTQVMIAIGFLVPVLNFLRNVAVALIAMLGAYIAMHQGLGIGMIVSFIDYQRRFTRPMTQLASAYSSLQSAVASGDRIIAFLDLPEDETYGDLDIDAQSGCDICFDNVNFSYDDTKAVLNNVSFRAAAGQKIALVGETGAGKTTIAALIARFYKVDSGDIRVGEHSIYDYNTNAYSRALGLVLQDSYLFKGTVEDNIRYANVSASEEEVIAAAKKARCHDFIMRLPNGYQTQLSAGAGALSHGERQLITIARAILASPKILILDEATSNVDTRTEKRIQDALLALMQHSTSIIIAHRLSTIRDADLILVLEGGHIVECGNHAQLMSARGAYYDMVLQRYESVNDDEKTES